MSRSSRSREDTTYHLAIMRSGCLCDEDESCRLIVAPRSSCVGQHFGADHAFAGQFELVRPREASGPSIDGSAGET